MDGEAAQHPSPDKEASPLPSQPLMRTNPSASPLPEEFRFAADSQSGGDPNQAAPSDALRSTLGSMSAARRAIPLIALLPSLCVPGLAAGASPTWTSTLL